MSAPCFTSPQCPAWGIFIVLHAGFVQTNSTEHSGFYYGLSTSFQFLTTRSPGTVFVKRSSPSMDQLTMYNFKDVSICKVHSHSTKASVMGMLLLSSFCRQEDQKVPRLERVLSVWDWKDHRYSSGNFITMRRYQNVCFPLRNFSQKHIVTMGFQMCTSVKIRVSRQV